MYMKSTNLLYRHNASSIIMIEIELGFLHINNKMTN